MQQEYNRKKGETRKGEERKTMTAAKSNKQGPYCSLCHHLEMALRYAEHRELTNVCTSISQAQHWIKHDQK